MSFIKILKRTGSGLTLMVPLSVLYCDYDIYKVVNTLKADSLKLINWFSINLMRANPDKFQAISIGKKTNEYNLTFNLNRNNITGIVCC
jgi:hypothetical protein